MDDTYASMEPRHAEFELKHDQERGTSASWNAESDTESNDTDSHEYGRGNGGPLSTSKSEKSDTDSNEDDRELSTKKESERDMVSSSGSSSGDVESEQEEVYNSSRDLPTGALDTQTFSEEEEKDEGTNAQETQSSPEFEAFTAEPSLPQNSPEFEAFTAEPSLPVDEVVEGSTESAPDTLHNSNEQSLGGNAGAPISTPEEINMLETRSRAEHSAAEYHERSLPIDEVSNGSVKITTETAGDSAILALGDNAEKLASKSEGRNEGDQSVESQSPKASIDQENKPSSSQSREIAPKTEELEEHSDHDPLETEDEYLKKGFTCGGNPEEDDEEQLREHWMRTLQTSTSTGEIVEEIVKVLKHQKTHDLLCPVCGSCVTRRVVLRKRKRSSLISVDRWYRDPLDEAETQELGSTLESIEPVEEGATEGYQDTEAYGCLSCFSLFFEKGRQLFNRLHADAGSERFNCLPFFFPPYPWGITQMRPRSPGMDEQVPREEVIEEPAESLSTVEGAGFSCEIGSALLPDYPWGTMPPLSKGELIQGSPISETVEEQQPQVKESTCTCGLAQALIPEYSWGYLSKAEEAAPQSPRDMEAVAQPEISEEVPELPRERRDCTCGLVPALLPAYPWGFFRKDEGAHNIQTQIVEETEGKGAEDKRSSCDVVAAVLPSYPWGMMTESPDVPEDGPPRNSSLESLQNVGSAILPLYPWGVCSQEQIVQVDEKDETRIDQVTSYSEQETTIEARITSKTDVYTVTSSKTTYPGEKPPQNIKDMVPNETSQTIKHVKLDQTVTIIDASVTVDEGGAIKGPALVSLPSTGYALLDMMDEGSEKGRLESTSSTGYAHLEEISEEAEPIGKDTPEQPPGKQTKGSKVVFSPTVHELAGYKQESEIKEEIISQSIQGGMIYKPEKPKPSPQSQFPSFQWSVEKLDAGDLKSSLLKGSGEPEAETVISVLKGTEKPKGQPWLSIFKLSKPSDEEGITSPLLSATGYMEEIEESKLPAGQLQTVIATEAVIDVPPADLGGTTVGTGTSTAAAVAAIPKKEADGWDILKSIVYGGLDISIASLAVTSSAAGGNAITRTVVYMGLATLLSGLIGFYHNVLNLYHHHREHYINVVGVTLLLHGTVALVSFVIFGLLSPLLYALSYRKTDNRDDKFILCCGVTIVAVILLSLGKAKVSNKLYIRTVCAYLVGGVLAAIIGYLTGEHVEELLEAWGL